jgi:hypothetical protein
VSCGCSNTLAQTATRSTLAAALLAIVQLSAAGSTASSSSCLLALMQERLMSLEIRRSSVQP